MPKPYDFDDLRADAAEFDIYQFEGESDRAFAGRALRMLQRRPHSHQINIEQNIHPCRDGERRRGRGWGGLLLRIAVLAGTGGAISLF